MTAYRPAALREALDVRASTGAIPCAGGTDLMVRFRRGAGALPALSAPVLLLDRCAELGRIEERGGRVYVGAAATLSALAASPLVPPVLREAVLSMGGPAIRNVGTLGGNVCNASPAGDTLPFLYAAEARVHLLSVRGAREMPVTEFIAGPGRTALAADEILAAVSFPVPAPPFGWWRKVGTRKANALTKVSVTALADLDEGRLRSVRLAVGAVAPTVVRLRDVEGYLESLETGWDAAAAQRVRAMTEAAVRPIDDQRSTAVYRRRVAGNLVLEAASGMLRTGRRV